MLFNTANILSLAILPDDRAVKLQALSADNLQMVNGKRIFNDNCTAFHVSNGTGCANMIPVFKGNNEDKRWK